MYATTICTVYTSHIIIHVPCTRAQDSGSYYLLNVKDCLVNMKFESGLMYTVHDHLVVILCSIKKYMFSIMVIVAIIHVIIHNVIFPSPVPLLPLIQVLAWHVKTKLPNLKSEPFEPAEYKLLT